MTRAVVVRELGREPEVVEVELKAPDEHEVRVVVAAAGICHSDLSLWNGTIPVDLPLVLGHEAAGVVREVGASVTGLRVGDHVVLNWAPPCHHCFYCERGEVWLCETNAGVVSADRGVRLEGAALGSALGLGAFSEEVVLPSSHVVALPDELPLEVAALLGCAVLTGLGAVVHTGAVRAGDSVLVVGLGGVGLSAVAGARLAGASRVIAVDRSAAKEELARAQGATDFLVADDQLARAVRQLTEGRGADHSFDCVGSPETIRTCWSSARRGGRVTVVGVGSRAESVCFNPLELFHFNRTLTSSIYGSSDPERDLPAIIDHALRGELDLAGLVTDRCGLDGVGAAFEQMQAGIGGRTVIHMDLPPER
jgi:S-(hydroxymethyl)glutathione dehydrogenase / alcohol dehydrogenase